MSQQSLESVREYYGQVLESNEDLKTDACCTADRPPEHIKELMNNIHEVVQRKFYGCGSPIPPALEGRTVLDLGCGSGRDVFLLSQMVGPQGRVIGIDMTEEQLSVAEQYRDWHMDRFGFPDVNVEFIHGYIEDLQSAGIADESIDLVVSNCVINLSPDKESVFSEVVRALKPAGEIYFSDVFAGRRIPETLRADPVLLGECLSGALYLEDFRRILDRLGLADYREISSRQLTLDDPVIVDKIGMIDFYSKTIRAFKMTLEDRSEDYGHVAFYKGTIPESPHCFELDDHYSFQTGMPIPVCGNTANILTRTRFADHFRVEGDFSTHFGAFELTPSSRSPEQESSCC